MTNFQDKYAHLKEHETPVVKRGNSSILLRAAPTEITPVDGSEDTFKFIITTNDVDRYGDIVEPSGLDATDYEKNNVVLFNHLSSGVELPIANSLSLEQTSDGKGIESVAKFHGITELSRNVRDLLKIRSLKATSIGFMPKEWENMPTEKGSWCEPRRYTKWSMLEYSVVNIPANPYALITNGFVSDVRKYMEDGIFTSESALVKHITHLISNGVSPDLKRAIEREMSGGKINLFPLSINKKKFNLSIKRQILC